MPEKYRLHLFTKPLYMYGKKYILTPSRWSPSSSPSVTIIFRICCLRLFFIFTMIRTLIPTLFLCLSHFSGITARRLFSFGHSWSTADWCKQTSRRKAQVDFFYCSKQVCLVPGWQKVTSIYVFSDTGRRQTLENGTKTRERRRDGHTSSKYVCMCVCLHMYLCVWVNFPILYITSECRNKNYCRSTFTFRVRIQTRQVSRHSLSSWNWDWRRSRQRHGSCGTS